MVTSCNMKLASYPLSVNSEALFSPSCNKSLMTTFAPAAHMASEIAPPIPLAPPEINAILSVRLAKVRPS